MNYIAHIQLANLTKTSLVGNFMGDFVKGSQLDYLPTHLEQGIRLHRSIDVFTDSHPLVVQLKQNVPKEIRRMAGVIIDIYFDHLLMQHWHTYSTIHFSKVFEQFYLELAQTSLPDNPRYTQQAQRLQEYQWLAEYAQLESCFRAFSSIEKRLKHKVVFAKSAEIYIQQNAIQLESTFEEFYPELIDHSLDFINA